jgi:ribosomal protein S17E
MAKNEILAGLLESDVLSEEVSQQISEAWEAQINEAREEITAELREEFAQKFEHDKSVIVEAMDNMLNTAIKTEMEEFKTDREQLIAERVAYKKAISEHAKLLEKFITSQLAKEVKELRADRAKVNEHLDRTKEFVVKQLSRELAEFHNDKRDLVETKVRMVAEGKEILTKTKDSFIKRSAELVENTINKALRSELGVLKDDIQSAKENEFGRKIFETFAGEFMTSQLSEGTEVAKITKKLEDSATKIAKLEETITAKEEAITSAETAQKVLEDRMDRKEVMEGLLSPLGKEKRTVMVDLLETVKTTNLKSAFKKYLPAVLNETVSNEAKQSLNEGKVTEHTGDRGEEQMVSSTPESQGSDANNIIQLKKLAGLK